MIGNRPYRRSEGNVLAGLEQIVVTVKPPNPLVLLWRWRYEVGSALVIGLTGYALGKAAGVAATIALAAATAATVGIALAMSPATRRFAKERVWCVVTAHRVRTGCAQARIHSRQGRLPFILLTSAAPYGERVLLWCRAGTSIEDCESARPILRAACWAADVQVNPSPRRAHLVILDVIHREPPTPRPAPRPRPATQPRPATPKIPRQRQPADQSDGTSTVGP